MMLVYLCCYGRQNFECYTSNFRQAILYIKVFVTKGIVILDCWLSKQVMCTVLVVAAAVVYCH